MPRRPAAASTKFTFSPSHQQQRRGGGHGGFPTILTLVCVALALYLFVVSKNSTPVELLLLQQPPPNANEQQPPPALGKQQQPHDAWSITTTTTTQEKKEKKKQDTTPLVHKVAGLDCKQHGGPAYSAEAMEMVYWRDIPADAAYESPFKKVGPSVKYLTFEPDEGGWNNIRMSMETAVTMALAMGRILVLPPEQELYLLHKNDGGQKNQFTFKDFFHFDSVELEHPALQVISFEEFLKKEAMTGHLKDTTTGKVSFPPNNQTQWKGQFKNFEAGKKGVFPWLRSVTKKLDWSWETCLAAFPEKPGPEAATKLQKTFDAASTEYRSMTPQERIKSYVNNPTPVDAPVAKRIRELLATRNRLCIYDDSFQQAPVVHLMGDNDSGARMLSHFYAFLLFEDWKLDQWIKRFVRDHLRYIDEIQCAAARYVEFLRYKARSFGNAEGDFYTMHIRRGDFQYEDTRIDADQIFQNVRDVIPVNSTLYIATDETHGDFFKIFAKNYRVYFLSSNPPLYKGLNSNYHGMLEQLIASKGKVFVGTYYSTFTGYINRMRGYHSQKDKTPGYEKGGIDSYYFVPTWAKNAVKEYHAVHPPYWAREFPVGWRDIDKSLADGA